MREIADGRVYSGEQAKELGLVDSFGGLDEAAEISEDLAGVDEATVVRYVQPESFTDALLASFAPQKPEALQIAEEAGLTLEPKPYYLYCPEPREGLPRTVDSHHSLGERSTPRASRKGVPKGPPSALPGGGAYPPVHPLCTEVTAHIPHLALHYLAEIVGGVDEVTPARVYAYMRYRPVPSCLLEEDQVAGAKIGLRDLLALLPLANRVLGQCLSEFLED